MLGALGQDKILPLDVDNWDEELRDVVHDMNGKPINVHKLMAHHPDLLKAWWDYRNYSVKGGSLGKRGGEIVILRVAMHMKAWYEWGSHVDRGLASGLTLDEIHQVSDFKIASSWSNKDALLLKAVDELIANHGLSADLNQQLLADYDLKAIMDVIAIKGMYVTLGCMINSWGLKLDDAVADRIKDHASEAEFSKAAEKFSAEKKGHSLG